MVWPCNANRNEHAGKGKTCQPAHQTICNQTKQNKTTTKKKNLLPTCKTGPKRSDPATFLDIFFSISYLIVVCYMVSYPHYEIYSSLRVGGINPHHDAERLLDGHPAPRFAQVASILALRQFSGQFCPKNCRRANTLNTLHQSPGRMAIGQTLGIMTRHNRSGYIRRVALN